MINLPCSSFYEQGENMDKEYQVLDLIEAGYGLTQREIAIKTGISLGSVNLLLKKMAAEGVIKFEKMPPNRFVYMLTPKGFCEKIAKTHYYIRVYYASIERTRRHIREAIEDQKLEEMHILLEFQQAEIMQMTMVVLGELGLKNRIVDRIGPSLDLKKVVILSDSNGGYSCNQKIINVLAKA